MSAQEIGRLNEVTKRIGSEEILHGIGYSVLQGEVLLITGPSGSGKSTSIRMLAGLETPTTGTVELFGEPFSDLSKKEQAKLVARNVSFSQQEPALDAGFNVFANLIQTPQELLGRRARKAVAERAGDLAVEFGIAHLLGKPAGGNLSGGEKAKVALCRALVKEPRLVILDEPTGAVDPDGTEEVHTLLRNIQQAENATVVMVAHDAEAARKIADREIIIDGGYVASEQAYPVY